MFFVQQENLLVYRFLMISRRYLILFSAQFFTERYFFLTS